MSYEISQKFFFDAAHSLKREVEADSSLRIHGHTYNAEVTLSGQPDPDTGMVVDLGLVRLQRRLRRGEDAHGLRLGGRPPRRADHVPLRLLTVPDVPA